MKMDWICGFLTGCIMGGIFAISVMPTRSKTESGWDPAKHPLEAEGEALDPAQGGGKV